MTQQVLHAVYQKGVFLPTDPASPDIPEGQKVRLVVEPDEERSEQFTDAAETLKQWTHVYDGLTEREIDGVEKIIMDRRLWFRGRDDR